VHDEELLADAVCVQELAAARDVSLGRAELGKGRRFLAREPAPLELAHEDVRRVDLAARSAGKRRHELTPELTHALAERSLVAREGDDAPERAEALVEARVGARGSEEAVGKHRDPGDRPSRSDRERKPLERRPPELEALRRAEPRDRGQGEDEVAERSQVDDEGRVFLIHR
jgi:hypothetical protein